MVKVEIWSDIYCPFCYIGKRHFEAGLKKFAHHKDVEIVHRSFELYPHMDVEPKDDVYGLAAEKSGTTREYMKAVQVGINKSAEEVGLTFNYDTAIHTNTFNAHRLVHYAAQFGKADDMLEVLYKAYFTDSLHVGNLDTLVDLAVQVGLDAEETTSMLQSNQFAEAVRADELAGERAGVRGVPYFVINGKYAIYGSQPEAVFTEALQLAWEEEKPKPIIPFKSLANDEEALICEDGSCFVNPNANKSLDTEQ